MAATALQSRTANIVVPSIHLGSFSPYPAMATDLKQPIRFPEDSTIPVFRDEKAPSYPQQRNSPQRRPNAASYPPNQAYAYNAYPTGRVSSYAPTPATPRTPPPANTLYPSVLQGPSPAPPIQPPNSPAQVPGPPREVCVECMMRDEDMADVDVTGPGVWERESDVYYQELCQREEEEERERDLVVHPSTSSAISSSASCSRPRAKGAKLTEGNLKVWLSLNPREPASKQQTLHTYLDAQNSLLVAESKARLQAIQESRQLDNKMRDAYDELRRSAYDLGASATALDDGGVKIRSPSVDDARRAHKRDTTLLENGMIVERVDMRKEQERIRKEERRARKVSRDSLSVFDTRDRERDATSLYSFQAAEGPASLRALAPYESTMSVPMPTSRSVRSMYTTPSSSWQQQQPNRPMSMMPGSGSAPGFASQTSIDSMGSPRRRFFGFKHWSGYFSSETSLAPSGSMMDMHLGLAQEKHLTQVPHVDIGSNAPSLREAWPRMDDGTAPDRPMSDRASASTRSKKKKRRGLGHLWKIITGAPSKTIDRSCAERRPAHEEVDEDLPLAPPPPISYLVSRGGAQSERSMSMMGPGRHLSMPSLTSSNGQHHPRSSSAPSGVGICVSSPSDQSSALPSPTEVRFPYRDSSGDEPEDGPYDEEADVVSKKLGGRASGSPPRPPLLSKISEPDFRRLTSSPASIPAMPPMTRSGPSSSSLVPTIKVPRPMSVMSLDKNLPPLPPGEHEPPIASPPPDRRSFAVPNATLPMAAYPHNAHALAAPNPGFRSEDAARRQSFSGIASRPALLPRGAGLGNGTPGVRYDDFGASRHSLAAFEPAPSGTAKRRSRFGIGALLGRKEKSSGGEQHRRDMSSATMPGTGSRELNYDAFAGHIGAPSVSMSMSERSSQHGLPLPSRRVLDELVPQDPDFIAYRYPSRDERLDLSRG